MKLTRQSVLTASSLLIGGFIGASALVALADSTWTAAPNCGAAVPCSNTPAPINAGGTAQGKLGSLAIGSAAPLNGINLDVSVGSGMFNSLAVLGNLIISAGASSTPNTILANVGSGKAQWVATSTLFGPGGGGGSSGVNKIIAGTGIKVTSTGTSGTGDVTVGVTGFGVRDDVDGNGTANTLSKKTTYTALTDGFVYADSNSGSQTYPPFIQGTINGNILYRAGGSASSYIQSIGYDDSLYISLTFPVKKGETWSVTFNQNPGFANIHWMPVY